MKRLCVLLPLLLLGADQPETLPVQPPAQHDPVAKLGTITGTLTPAQSVQRVWAIDRNLDLTPADEEVYRQGKYALYRRVQRESVPL